MKKALTIQEMNNMTNKELWESFYDALNDENREHFHARAGVNVEQHLDQLVNMYHDGALEAEIDENEPYVDINEYYEWVIEGEEELRQYLED